MDEWVPMREQYCVQRVVGDWLKVPQEVVRTKTNPMSEVLGKEE